MDVDLVIPYVNGNDPIWKKQYEPYKDIKIDQGNTIARYRDYGTLPYLFRSIEKCIPWIRKVFLIVSGPSQVPKWLDTTNPKLRIVYHEEYIPKEYLPTFNANTIECLLWRIEDLSEYFIYGNDDLFFKNPLKPEDFFEGDKLKVNVRFKTKSKNTLNQCMWNNCVRLAIFNNMELSNNETLVQSDHGFCPKRKSGMKEMYDYWGNELWSRITPVRDRKNITQWAFNVYEWDKGNTLPCDIKNNSFDLKDIDLSNKLIDEYDTFCANDYVHCDFLPTKNKLHKLLNGLFPDKCSFEKEKYTPLVSIIVPVYNLENYIIRTLETIQNQTYKNFECLIIDDGSTDKTEEVIQQWIKSDNRFKYFYKQNSGVGSARNFGIDVATGEYITFMDGDDIMKEDCVKKCVQYLQDHIEDDLVFTEIIKYCLDGSIKTFYPKHGIYELQDIINKNESFTHVWGAMYRSDFLTFRFNDCVNHEDVMFLAECIIKNKRAVVIDYLGVIYMERENSAVTSVKANKLPIGEEIKFVNAWSKLFKRAFLLRI